jgi:hypothetical protein
MKITTILSYFACAALSVGILPATLLHQSVHAVESERSERIIKNTEQTTDDSKNKGQERASQVRQDNKDDKETDKLRGKSLAAEKKAAVVARLDAKKLEMCSKKQDKITSSMQRVSAQGLNQLDVFKKIADRTIAFYKSKGRTVTNYDQLVADVNAKYKAAKTAVDSISTTSTFDCSSDNPKEALSIFRDNHKQKTAALKEYKTSIKNLIVAVKSAQAEQTPPEVEAR